ncbi:PAT complex subunit CCDC47, partial [Lecanoromycetidae sp. Uapishka_2]
MADYIKGLFRGQPPVSSGEDDFADFAGAPDPTPASISPVTAQAATPLSAAPTTGIDVVYTKWYRVWERTSPSDFYAEAVILPFVIVIIGLHIWGRRKNKRKANRWIEAHAPALQKEYALVGYRGRREPSNESPQMDQQEVLKEKTAQEYTTYATGRQNVASTEVKLYLYKRYNPATLIVEFILSFLFESIRAPTERMEATSQLFDGREKELVPAKSQQQLDAIESQARSKSSVYDQFVFAIVHKDLMKSVREDRYDISLTSTKDHASLPMWATTMSESATITEALLTPELVKAVETAGDAFEHLIITDQPLDKPQKLNETAQKKRISISLKVPSSVSPSAYEATLPIFSYFLRLPDVLVQSGKFRAEVRRKIQAVREEEQKKLRKASDEEKTEERRLEGEKKKREIRDSRLNGMSAEEQRKFLEKEREKNSKKQEKKMSRKP